MKKRRETGVEFLMRLDSNIVVNEIIVSNPRNIAINLEIHGFNIRIVNAYSLTEADSSENKKGLVLQITK